jgi:hypothetical protein
LKPFARIPNPRELRKKLGVNQMEFWSQIGVTQSGGSRYESGRAMSKPVRELLPNICVSTNPRCISSYARASGKNPSVSWEPANIFFASSAQRAYVAVRD